MSVGAVGGGLLCLVLTHVIPSTVGGRGAVLTCFLAGKLWGRCMWVRGCFHSLSVWRLVRAAVAFPQSARILCSPRDGCCDWLTLVVFSFVLDISHLWMWNWTSEAIVQSRPFPCHRESQPLWGSRRLRGRLHAPGMGRCRAVPAPTAVLHPWPAGVSVRNSMRLLLMESLFF